MSPEWMIDERQHAGEEHLDPEEVARYDEKIPFDPSGELDRLMELGLSAEDTLVDFGAGTGIVALASAPHCSRVVAVDVSEAMLDRARENAQTRNVRNVEFVHDGFVSYEHEGEPAAFAFSKNALHHLPDFWKVEALKNVGSTLEPGGIFRFRDLVYSFGPDESHDAIESWLDGMDSTAFSEEELHAHFREEFSTYDFLMEPMLEEAGFEIVDANYRDGFYAAYTCEWRGDET